MSSVDWKDVEARIRLATVGATAVPPGFTRAVAKGVTDALNPVLETGGVGPQGPPGPTGPTGPSGATGPAGRGAGDVGQSIVRPAFSGKAGITYGTTTVLGADAITPADHALTNTSATFSFGGVAYVTDAAVTGSLVLYDLTAGSAAVAHSVTSTSPTATAKTAFVPVAGHVYEVRASCTGGDESTGKALIVEGATVLVLNTFTS